MLRNKISCDSPTETRTRFYYVTFEVPILFSLMLKSIMNERLPQVDDIQVDQNILYLTKLSVLKKKC